MKRKNSLREAKKYRSVGVILCALLLGLSVIGYLAQNWRKNIHTIRCTVQNALIASPKEIIRAAAIPDSTSIADIDLKKISMRIERHPFVKRVDLLRNPPDELIIRVFERKPIALILGQGNREFFIDDDGVILPHIASPYIFDLPILSGIPATIVLAAGNRVLHPRVQQALDVLRTAKSIDEQLYHTFSEINLTQDRDLILYTLEHGIPVIFGTALSSEKKLRSFEAFWKTVALRAGASQLEYIDVRYQERVIAKYDNQFIKPAPAVRDSIIEEL